MRTVVVGGLSILLLALWTGVESLGAPRGGKPKYDISEVMQKAHKSGLYKKVATGKADADEKKQLVEYYTALSKNKPPMGDEAAWMKQTSKMLMLAKSAAEGDEKAAKELLK